MDEIEAIARIICQQINGIVPVDLDGSSNWWMFQQSAKDVLAEHSELGVKLTKAWDDHRDAVRRIQEVIVEVKKLVPPLAPTAGSGWAS